MAYIKNLGYDVRSCGRVLRLGERGGEYLLDENLLLHRSICTLSQLNSLEVNTRLPAHSFSSIVGLPLLKNLSIIVTRSSPEPVRLCPESSSLTKLRIMGEFKDFEAEEMVGLPAAAPPILY
jgi:hypothetical protein